MNRNKKKGATFVELVLVFSVIILAIAGYTIYYDKVADNSEAKYFSAAGSLNRLMAETGILKLTLSGAITFKNIDFPQVLAPIVSNLEDATNYSIELCLAVVKKTDRISLASTQPKSVSAESCLLPEISPRLCSSEYCLAMFAEDPGLQAKLTPILVPIHPYQDDDYVVDPDGTPVY